MPGGNEARRWWGCEAESTGKEKKMKDKSLKSLIHPRLVSN